MSSRIEKVMQSAFVLSEMLASFRAHCPDEAFDALMVAISYCPDDLITGIWARLVGKLREIGGIEPGVPVELPENLFEVHTASGLPPAPEMIQLMKDSAAVGMLEDPDAKIGALEAMIPRFDRLKDHQRMTIIAGVVGLAAFLHRQNFDCDGHNEENN